MNRLFERLHFYIVKVRSEAGSTAVVQSDIDQYPLGHDPSIRDSASVLDRVADPTENPKVFPAIRTPKKMRFYVVSS